ncbi:Secreted protein [Pseudomonas sp. IT-P44]
MSFALRSAFTLGIGLATGAPDTHTAPTLNGSPPENSQPPVGLPTGGFVFSAPTLFSNNTDILRIHDMNYATYYRHDSFTAWRFSSLRSGQPAASDRSPTGGEHTHAANPANCRTPQ